MTSLPFTFIALLVLMALRFSAITWVTPLMDMTGVVLPPCLLTALFKCNLKVRRRDNAKAETGVIV